MKKLINILKNITNRKLYTANRTLHTAYCTLQTAHCILKNRILRTAYCILNTAYCILNTAYCILNTAYCKLPTAILPTIILIFSQLATAQVYPVQVTPQLIPPYSLKLSDYATTQSEKLIVNVLMTDINENNRQLRFKFSIKGNGLQVQSNDMVMGANPIFVDGGIPLRLTNLDLRPYFELQNLSGITPQQYNSPLPNGMYQFCFEVFDWLTGQRLSRKHCFPAYLIINDPPFLNIPSNGDLIEVQNPQNILFNWTPRHLNATGVQYEFELREIWDTQIDPQAAFLATPNLYRTMTINNTLLYGPGETTLLENKTYAWRVRAIAGDGISEASIFKNNGYSEIHYFTYTADCKAPQFPLAKSKSTRSEEITWQPDVNYLRFRVQYRKKGVRDAVWFEVNSQNPYTTLYNLEAGTTYEYRVGGQCTQTINRTEPRFSYTAIQEFTTPIKNEDAAYNCGIVPEINITNREPITNLGVNEVFTAGDFPVTIKQIHGGNGVYSGIGYIVVPYLADTKIAVEFNNIRINSDYQLYQGTLYTTYDASWGNVDDVQDEIDAVVEIPQAIGELISELFEQRKEKLLELQQLQEDLANAIITQEEFDVQAGEVVIDVKAIDDELSGAVSQNIINNEFATEEEKREAEKLEQSKSLVSTNTNVSKALENQKHINERLNEIASAVAERDHEDLLLNLLIALQAQDGKSFLKCKDCDPPNSESTSIIDGTKFIAISSLKANNNAYKYFKCIIGSIKTEGTILPEKFDRQELSLEKKKALREELNNQFSTLSNLINTSTKNEFLLVSQTSGNLLDCTTPLAFEDDYCSTQKVSDQEITSLTKELRQCAPVDITNTHAILTGLQRQIRSNQAIEWATNGKVYVLNESGQVEEVESPLSDEEIENGKWTDESIDLKMRMSFDENGILQYDALGIRSSLSNEDGKTVDNKTVAKNMRETANVLMQEYKVQDIEITLQQSNFAFDSDAYPDGKKVDINKNVSYIKFFSELGGITTTFLKTTEVEQPVYVDDYDKNTQVLRAPPVLTGTLEGAAKEVTEITSMVVMGYDLATKPEVRKQTVEGFVAIKNQVVDNPSSLFPLLKEVVIEEATGLTPEDINELNIVTGSGQHNTSKGTVRTVATIVAGSKFLSELPEMAAKLSLKMLRQKLLKQFDELGWDEAAKKAFKKDFAEAPAEILEKFVKNPKLAEAWKGLRNSDIDDVIRTNTEALEKVSDAIDEGLDAVDAIEDAIETITKPKPTWPEVQALFKRGNDFNRKVRNLAPPKFDFHEVTVEHIINGNMKKFRLDSYNEGFDIVSRKATDFDNIQISTFEKYCQELITKYKVGTKITAPKYPELNGKTLIGKYKLEVPASNQTSSKLEEFNKIAQSKGIEIIFEIE